MSNFLVGKNFTRTNNIFVALGNNVPFKDMDGPTLFGEVLKTFIDTGLTPVSVSSLWISPAWPDPDRRIFQNAIAKLSTDSLCVQATNDASLLLTKLQYIEKIFGRNFPRCGFDRTLDLDLIDFRGMSTSADSSPALPHPLMHGRSFVTGPLSEIEPDWRHPVTGLRAEQLHDIAMRAWPCYRGEAIVHLKEAGLAGRL